MNFSWWLVNALVTCPSNIPSLGARGYECVFWSFDPKQVVELGPLKSNLTPIVLETRQPFMVGRFGQAQVNLKNTILVPVSFQDFLVKAILKADF